MALTYKKITTVNEISQLSEDATIFVNDNGTLRQAKVALFVSGASGNDTAALHFKGLLSSLPADTSVYTDGDVILVGEKEYIFYANAWYEFGTASSISGADGEDGITYTPQIGTVETAEPDDDAAVWVVIDDETRTATYSFTIPRGQKGDPGIQGDPGAKGDTGNGIASIEQTVISAVDNGVNVLTITLDDGTVQTFEVRNGSKGSAGESSSGSSGGEDGVGIQSVEQTVTSTEDGGTNIITITLTDGTVSSFKVQNGTKGSAGEDGVGIVSLNQTSTSSADGGYNTWTAMLSDGTQSAFVVRNGNAGTDGSPGENGGYYIPNVDETTGVLSWSSSKSGMDEVATSIIKGADGQDGQDGSDGADGGYYVPSVDADGYLSWSASKNGMPTVEPVQLSGGSGSSNIVVSTTQPTAPVAGMIWLDIS